MDLYHIGENCTHIIAISNSGNLAADFYKYGCSFYDAAEQVIHYLCNEAAEKHDIAKLDLWYFATVYLYRQSLELLLKANIFQTVMNGSDRKKLVGKIRHNLRQSFEQLIALRNLSIDENENGKWLMAYLSDISRLDEESDMFRYPFGSKFKTLFKKQTHISLVATHNNMNKAYKIIKELFDTGNLSEQTYESSLPQLIVEGGEYYLQSVVGYKYSNHSFYPYFSSYHEVGNFLKDIIMEKKTQNLFMPMCYLYRNAVELGLKRFSFSMLTIEWWIAVIKKVLSARNISKDSLSSHGSGLLSASNASKKRCAWHNTALHHCPVCKASCQRCFSGKGLYSFCLITTHRLIL